MFIPKCLLLYGILLAVLLEPISGRKFGGHASYPKSGGLSGGGSHRPGGLSGGGHGYPGGSHAYPPAGGSHAYPPAGGSHAYPPAGGSHAHPPAGGSHGYPPSGGLSGHGTNRPGTVTNVYNHYNYNPPQQISYAQGYGAPVKHYPVYQGTPPTYVYQYKDSGSKYGTLLAGLALLNLGTLAGAAYAHSNSKTHYKPQPGELCKFAIKKENGDYEETKIDCQIISSFILQDQQAHTTGANSTVTMTTVTNTTVTNTTNMMPGQASTPAPVAPVLGNVLYTMLPNGTLVPVNVTGVAGIPGLPGNAIDGTHNETSAQSPNGSVITSSVVTTTTNTTIVNALDVKGKPVEVTSGMKCYVIRTSPTSNMKKNVPCGLLQQYAVKSIHKNSAARNGPMFTMVAAIIAVCIAS